MSTAPPLSASITFCVSPMEQIQSCSPMLWRMKHLPKERARLCRRQYGELNYAFHQLIVPHLDQQLAKKVMDKSWLPADDMPEACFASPTDVAATGEWFAFDYQWRLSVSQGQVRRYRPTHLPFLPLLASSWSTVAIP